MPIFSVDKIFAIDIFLKTKCTIIRTYLKSNQVNAAKEGKVENMISLANRFPVQGKCGGDNMS